MGVESGTEDSGDLSRESAIEPWRSDDNHRSSIPMSLSGVPPTEIVWRRNNDLSHAATEEIDSLIKSTTGIPQTC
jgi:hypothetical protein